MQLLATLGLAAVAAASPFPGWPHGGHGGEHGEAPCSEAVVALATGIHLNIVGQYAEYNGTLKVIEVESSTPVDQTAFEIAKGELLSDIQGGMNIRLFNQQIAPAGNAAIPGLAKYQAAQQTEQNLAMGLTGVPSEDKSALDMLKSDIMAGIKLNHKNLKAAISGCEFTLNFPPEDESG